MRITHYYTKVLGVFHELRFYVIEEAGKSVHIQTEYRGMLA